MLTVHSGHLAAGETQRITGIQLTTVARTAFDCRHSNSSPVFSVSAF